MLRVQRSDGERGLTPTDRVVPGVGFEPTSPRLQRGAFTRLASQAELKVVRPTGIEPMSARWHRAALPLSYGRPSFHEWCTAGLRTCETRRHLIYSQASLPLEYLCAMDGAGNRKHRPHPCWRKADGSNAAPCGALPFSRRVAGHSSGAFPCWTSRRDLNARPPPSDGGALIR